MNKDAGKRTKSVVKKPTRFGKCLRIFVIVLLVIFVANWLYNAYVAITTVKITDVVEDRHDMVELVLEEGVQKTLVVYENTLGQEQANLFILAIIFNPDTSQALIYYFPHDLYLKDSFTDQYVSIANLTYAGDTYFYDDKYAYVVRQISDSAGFDFNSYVWIRSDMVKNFFVDEYEFELEKDGVLNIFSKLSATRLLFNYRKANIITQSLHSNMNFVEIYSYFQKMRGVVGSRSYEYIDLGSKNMSQEVVLGVGDTVKAIDVSAFDSSLNSNYSILMCRNLEREHVKVEVYNGSDIPMYARKVARHIHNSGCNVVRHQNAPETYEKNYIYIPDRESYSTALDRILTIIDDPVIVEGRPTFLTTGDIVVVLGSGKNEVF